MRPLVIATTLFCSFLSFPFVAVAQDTSTTNTSDTAEAIQEETLLTAAELQTLVAPIALFPDTLLIQILVGATVPFDVMKADRLLLENADASPEDMKSVVEAQGYDASVEVLATAFPNAIHDMAEHIDWTETVGDAMLAQSDDVMDAVQVMRDQAINTGALVSNEQQTVTEDPETEAVVIQPADPEVIYVPQYDAQAVYDPGFGVGDAVVAGLITWGTIVILDEIFDDDDHWDNYWGCRNCAGWGGGPIIRNPDIDIDIDGNVNIGNDIDVIRNRLDTGDITIDNDDLRARVRTGDIDQNEFRNRVNSGDIQINDTDLRARLDNGNDVAGWKPEETRSEDARAKISSARGEDGASSLPIDRPSAGGSDALRAKLSERTGAADISRPGERLSFGDAVGAAATGTAANIRQGNGLNIENTNTEKLKAKTPAANAVTKPAAKKKPAAQPKVNRVAPSAKIKKPAQQVRKPAPKIAKKSSGPRAKAAASRGNKAPGRKLRR